MNTDRTAIIAVTAKGAHLAEYLSAKMGADLFLSDKINHEKGIKFSSLKDCFNAIFYKYDGIVAVMAQGIVSRMTAPLLQSKHTDPAVVVCDEVGRYAISAVSGHEGGANRLAHYVASISGAVPVITTATEANKLFIAGIGCRKNTTKENIISAVEDACKKAGIEPGELRMAASAWVKADEPGLINACAEMGLYLRFLPEHLYINSPYDVKPSAAANHFSIKAVAEPSALLAGFNTRLILPKTIYENVTIAIAKEMTLFS